MTVGSRYDIRKEMDATWTVFAIFTHLPAEINVVKIMQNLGSVGSQTRPLAPWKLPNPRARAPQAEVAA